MDATDRDILAALRRDARISFSDLAAALGLSRTTVRARVERMREDGRILGFTVVLKEDAARDPVRALMMIGIEGRGTDRVLRQLGGLPEVRGLHSTNGRWDVIAELGTPDLETLDAVLNNIRAMDGVATSETSLLLSTKRGSGAQLRR
ncbi:DNA-binding transcriptional regulator, Lrp family [Roseivivax halotolerans]|uniref:DNA-binding transcriptional regulator, Lrp family n=1 Tax=Roseivivax halotolerans TaxID=93684 RepID=A0A1I5Z7G6_9RHOB|nr:Lrp/AsnC family transcriptional regulator [Roseivivax halotolerans]SFQ52394.1 DNA-binding transcriptional regulator, Lrp family [Roseivivax halotolerans]